LDPKGDPTRLTRRETLKRGALALPFVLISRPVEALVRIGFESPELQPVNERPQSFPEMPAMFDPGPPRGASVVNLDGKRSAQIKAAIPDSGNVIFRGQGNLDDGPVTLSGNRFFYGEGPGPHFVQTFRPPESDYLRQSGRFPFGKKMVLVRNGAKLHHIHVRGYNSDRESGGSHSGFPLYEPTYAFDHGFELVTGDNIELIGCRATDTAGDGIYMQRAKEIGNWSEHDKRNIRISRCVVAGAGRQGIVPDGQGVTVEDCWIWARRSGIDVETVGYNLLANIVIRRNAIWAGNRSLANLGRGKVEDLAFENNLCLSNLGITVETRGWRIDIPSNTGTAEFARAVWRRGIFVRDNTELSGSTLVRCNRGSDLQVVGNLVHARGSGPIVEALSWQGIRVVDNEVTGGVFNAALVHGSYTSKNGTLFRPSEDLSASGNRGVSQQIAAASS
jgi:hypothetical protein